MFHRNIMKRRTDITGLQPSSTMRNETGAVSGVEKPRGPDVSVVSLLPTAARGEKKQKKKQQLCFLRGIVASEHIGRVQESHHCLERSTPKTRRGNW